MIKVGERGRRLKGGEVGSSNGCTVFYEHRFPARILYSLVETRVMFNNGLYADLLYLVNH